jgi:hypothetical protein
MKAILTASLALGSALFGATLPTATISGSYIEARNADVYTGACYANSEINLVGDLAVLGWKIDKGSVNGVSLDGLGVVGILKATSTLGDNQLESNPTKSVLIVDEKATPAQRAALIQFAKRMGGQLFADVVKVESRPISLTFANDNLHSMKAKLTAGEIASIETRPITGDDKICRHESTYYPPLTATKHAMAAFALENRFSGDGLGTKFNAAEKRSAFVAQFEVPML